MATMELSPAVVRRVNKLAKEAGRTPEEMMPFVLKEGLDFCEEDVRLTKLADDECEAGKVYTFDEMDRRVRQAIAHAAKVKAA
jgi:predicted transcriptional regulator